MNIECTLLGSVTGYVNLVDSNEAEYIQKTATVRQILDLGNKWRNKIDVLRQLPYHSPEQLKLKDNYPCWMPTGIFADGNVKNEGIVVYSNMLAVDIDFIDNPDVNTIINVKNDIFNMKSVIFVMDSISGKGLYALFLVEDGRFTTEYCKYLEVLFKSKYNVIIDDKCYNIGRKRFLSYDDDILIKADDIDIVPWKLKLIEDKPETVKESTLFDYKQKYTSNVDEDNEFERKVDLLIQLGYDTGEHWIDWAAFGRIFKPFNNGKELFERISQKMSGYNAKKFDKDWARIDDSYINTKDHAIAYITTILNKNYSNWKDYYYKNNNN